jgi:peptidoglycan/xylan/chitin deacetylase (PgdA/CDA1 family)
MRSNNLFILNFHSIFLQNERNKYHYDPVYSISLIQFEYYLNWIHSKKITCANWENILKNKYSSNDEIAISFDDGHLSDYELAIPLLTHFKIDACFFIIADIIQKDQNARERIKKISDLGFTIGSHGLTHKKLTKLNYNEQKNELIESKKIIEDCIGKKIHFIAFPKGRYNDLIIDLCKKAGYSKSFSTFNKWNDTSNKTFNFGRWSIKQKTTLNQLESTVLKNKITLKKNFILSFLKLYLLKSIDLLNLKSK